ncbi:MAG TPA: hypothetical protein ENI45_01975, partial [Thermoplasmatales archaeon]|nr:hypothetical protein [Thermoplasmatales archaeon]
MKKELFIVGIVGIFLTSSLLSASASNPVKMSDEIPHVDNNYDGMQTSYHETNTADFGVMGSINREKSFGAAIVSEKPLLEANWIAKQNEASGYLTMTIANFIQNESGETLNNYRLSTYRITVHDGPSTSDPVLFTDEKEVLENAGDMISDLIFPVTIDTKGQSSRELAVERTAQTQLVSNIFQMPMKGKEGLETKTTAFHVTFVSPASVEKNTD